MNTNNEQSSKIYESVELCQHKQYFPSKEKDILLPRVFPLSTMVLLPTQQACRIIKHNIEWLDVKLGPNVRTRSKASPLHLPASKPFGFRKLQTQIHGIPLVVLSGTQIHSDEYMIFEEVYIRNSSKFKTPTPYLEHETNKKSLEMRKPRIIENLVKRDFSYTNMSFGFFYPSPKKKEDAHHSPLKLLSWSFVETL